jgi:hypothetical protein
LVLLSIVPLCVLPNQSERRRCCCTTAHEHENITVHVRVCEYVT